MAREYVMNSWGYGVILISRDWILCLFPLFFGEMEKLPQILPKIWRWPHLSSCRDQTAERVKTGKYYFKQRIIVWWKICKFPFTHFWGIVADALGVPSRLPLAMEYQTIAAVWNDKIVWSLTFSRIIMDRSPASSWLNWTELHCAPDR